MITKIQEDVKDAMRSKNTDKLNVLRALKNEITNTALRKGSVNEEVSELEILGLIRKEVAKRRDSVKAFTDAGRNDLANKENLEISILEAYLPVEMSDDELREHVVSSCVLLAATTKKDMGRVIKAVVGLTEGRADSRRISQMVGEILA